MKITIQSGINIWRIAGRTVSVDGVGIYQGRLLNELRITKQLARVGNVPITLPINIRNNDGYISSAVDLWGASVSVESDSGYTWQGKITAYDSDGGGIMYIVATEKTAPELLVKFPDEVARLVTVDENFHVSALNVTLPMVVGGTVEKPILVKGILVDKVNGIYLLCVGENHQIANVYRGTELLTAGFVAYTGTVGQANYPGFAYVQLTDESLRKNDDGTYVEISADVVGLKLGTHTIEECRNGARFLLWLLKTAREGVGGWGLGIAESDIDLDAFNTAIARVNAAGLKMDGIFYFRQIAQSWIDQICHAIRGSYSIGDNGKRRLFVNAPAASRKTYTKKNIKLLRYGKGAYTGQVYNKGKIEFGFNPLVGQFTQTAQYEDATSIGAIDEQEFTGQSYLVREMATGKALVDYTCKKSEIGATKVYFETKELPNDCHEGDIITVDYPEKGISGTWQINILDIGDRKHRIEAEKFSDTIFVPGTPGTAIDWSQDPPIVAPFLPGAPTGLDLSTVIDYDSAGDGAARPFIEGTFTPPEGKYLGAAVFWGLGAEPVTWNSHGSIRGTTFRVGPVKAGQLYTVKVHLFNQSGPSAEITGSIVGGSHTELPPAPTATASAGLGCIVVNIAMPAFSALAGFDIQRQTSAGAELTTVASGHRSTFFPDDSPSIIAAYGTYQYRVRAVSNSRQTSAWSAWTTSVSATQAQSKDITANQIIAKDFRTACNVGCAQNGVMFNAAGLQAWCGGVKTVDIPVSGSPSFSGTITAAAGAIAGWCINANALWNSTTANFCANTGYPGLYLGAVHQQGVSMGTGFRYVTGSTATPNGDFGISIGSCLLHPSVIWYNRKGIMIASSTAGIVFRVDVDCAGNNLCANIAGWNFNTSCLWASNILLNSAGSMQTCDFVTGNKGWKICCNGNAEFSNICARGSIHTAVFVKDEISVVGGCTMIRPAGVSKYECVMASYFGVYLDDGVSNFAINDIIRIKDGTNDLWAIIDQCGCNTCGCYITANTCSGTPFTYYAGQAVVNYGSRLGCGGVLLNGQSPYIDIYTHAGAPWNGTESRVRLGNLNGWGTISGATYGIAVGCPTGHHMTFDSVSGILKIRGAIDIQAANAAPSGAGLYLGADYMGYYNGSAWSTYMNNTGCFYLGGTSGNLRWNGSALTVIGIICATSGCFTGSISSCCGTIAGWTMAPNYLAKAPVGGGSIAMSADAASIYTHRICANCGEWHGQIYNNGWTGRYGFAVTRGLGVYMFRSDSNVDGSCACNQFAGWDFNQNALWKSSTLCGTAATGYPGLYLGAISDGVASLGLGFRYVEGSTASPAGDFGISIGNCLLHPSVAWYNRKGIMIASSTAGIVFRVDMDSAGNNLCANIAGWNFNAACLYSGNLIMNSAGSIAGNYTAGSAGWCISSTGAAEFNNVTVRGSIYSCVGKIGLWSLCSTGLYHSWSLGGNCGTSNVILSGFYFHQTSATIGGKAYLNVWQCCSDCSAYSAILCIDTYGTSQYAFYTNGKIQVNSVACSSDRNLKTDFQAISVLPMIRQTPITKWRFKDSQDYQVGWMAQDFHSTFRLAHDWETNLTVGGLDGIALRGVQELDECVAYNNRRILDLESRNACLETRLNCLETEFLQLKKAA